ncbi:MAG: cell division protein SepF [Clostridia bacterium]|nr:cell division protein SepF [Clostridia bacterium]
MAVPAFKKIMNYLWGENEETAQENYSDVDDIQNGYEETIEDEEVGESLGLFRKKAKVVNMPQQIKMKIAKPTNFDQVDEIISELKLKNAIVINLEYVNKDVARRIVDVISGAIKALDGHIEKVSNSIFVVAPFNYDIINEVTKEKIENKFSASWVK